MPASAARIIANQANAKLSTGPKTPEGKGRSRRNGLKHGLTGEGIVVPEEDSAEIDRRTAEFGAELDPRSSVGRFLVRKMALLSVRIERSMRQENAAIALRVRHAAEDFDQARLDEADRLLDLLGEEPRAHLRKLRRSPEGVERLIEAWEGLRDDLTLGERDAWTASHRERAENLTGVRIDDAGNSTIGALSDAIWGDSSGLEDEEEAGVVDDGRNSTARAALVELIDAEIAELEAHYQTLDFARIAKDRAGAPARSLFDPSSEATLARRYESEDNRNFDKALKQLRQSEAEAEERESIAVTVEPEADSDTLGSSWDRPTAPPREPRPGHDRVRVPAVEACGGPVGGFEGRVGMVHGSAGRDSGGF